MTERDWELYRLSVAESMPDSPYKKAVIDGIRHKLEVLEEDTPARIGRAPSRGNLANP
jgi:hypothetical protein